MSKQRSPALFLDRDGTLNEDPGYLKDPARLKLLPNATQALKGLQKAGYKLIVCSNQSGINRGYMSFEQVDAVHRQMDHLFQRAGIRISDFYYCHHHPDEACLCRKPNPELILKASRDHDLDIEQSYMVGDRMRDVKTGRNAGCGANCLVLTGEGQKELAGLGEEEKQLINFVGDDLLQVADWILNSKRPGFEEASDPSQEDDK